MKKILINLTVLYSLASMESFASTAKIDSLQGARFYKDVQHVFINPAYISSHQNTAVFETGTAGTAGAGFFKNIAGKKAGVYVGNRTAAATLAGLKNLDANENPIEIFLAQDNWGVSLSYASFKNVIEDAAGTKTADKSGRELGLRFGMIHGQHDFYVHTFLTSSWEDKARATDAEYSRVPSLAAGYMTDYNGWNITADLQITNEEHTDKSNPTKNAVDSARTQTLQVVALDTTSWKKKVKFYFGPGFRMIKLETEDETVGAATTKTALSSYSFPVFIGTSVAAMSWMDFRASLSQNIPLGSMEQENADKSKTETSMGNNTTITAGLGLKYNNLVVDVLLEGARTGFLNSRNFGTNMGFTYKF